MTAALTENEMHCWVLWKQATDRVWEQVGERITAATGLSVADFSVLTRTVEAAGNLRQQDLADSLGWSRSRLSRQVSRMVGRGLLARSVSGAVTTVVATKDGRRLATAARAAHAEAVRLALLDVHPPGDREFWGAVQTLGSAQPPRNH